jgi:hypothetical protein
VILHLQLDAGALACHKHAADNSALDPDLAALTNDEGLGRWPRVIAQVASSYLGSIRVARVLL